MKRLILMRHAKSDWAAGQPDHQRPLNKRGRKSASALGDWLRHGNHLPDEVLCSSATRTRETLDRLALDAPARFEDRLYHAGPVAMLKTLQTAEGACVLMLGHNPGIAEFAHELVTAAPGHPRFTDYPTGATLVVDFPADSWAEVEAGTGKPVAFVIPRELIEA